MDFSFPVRRHSTRGPGLRFHSRRNRHLRTDHFRNISGILVAKFSWTAPDVMAVLQSYLVEATQVAIHGNIANACRDPKDDMVLECAVAAKAEIIVSGDKDLLDLRRYQGISIVTAREYLHYC